MSLKDFLDWVHCAKKIHFKYEQHHSRGWDPRLNKKEEEREAAAFISL